MNRTGKLLLLAFLMVMGANLSGQQKGNGKAAPKAVATKIFVPPVYFGSSDYKGGPIQRDKFAMFLRQGLSSHDSLGNHYKIVGFDFSYAEQKVYEDSIGNLIKVTDFMSEYMAGDTISKDIATDADTSNTEKEPVLSIYQRVKPGDTVYFDHIMVEKIGKNSMLSIPDSITIAARPIKCVIVK